MRISIAFLALVALALPAHAQVFKCQEDGKAVYRDRPCHADAQPIDLKPARGAYDPAAARVLEQQMVRRLQADAAEQRSRDTADERREMARARQAAAPDHCDELRATHADAEEWAGKFRHPDNIAREQKRAKDAKERSFFDCPPSKRVSAFDKR